MSGLRRRDAQGPGPLKRDWHPQFLMPPDPLDSDTPNQAAPYAGLISLPSVL